MPVRNAAATLSRCLQSLAQQSFTEFEILAWDDGSTDETSAILHQWAAKDGRLRPCGGGNPQGITPSLISACALAQGEWIARQDADDWSEPERLSALLSYSNLHPQCVAVGSWVQQIAPCGEILEEVIRPPDPVAATHCLLHEGKGPPAHGAMMFRSAAYHAVGGYRPQFFYAQDCDLWYRLAEVGPIGYVPSVLYNYSISTTAISSQKAAAQAESGRMAHACLVARLRGTSEDSALASAARLSAKIASESLQAATSSRWPDRGASATLYRIGAGLASKGHPSAKTYFFRAFCRNPLNWPAFLRWTGQKLLR